MKKWLVAVLIVLALLVLVAPGIVGRLAEQNIEENIDWAESDSPGVNIQTESFERGWFTSVGRHRVVLEGGQFAAISDDYRDATGNPELPSLLINTEMDHGPLPGGALSPGLASTVSTFQVDPGNGELIDVPGTLTSKVGLAGDSDSTLLLEAGSFERDGATIAWQGVDMNIVSNPGPGMVSVDGEIKPWSINDGESSVNFSAITLTADQVRSDYGFSVGSVNMAMGKIEVLEDGAPFSVDGVTITAESSIDGDRVNAQSAIAMNTMTIPVVGDVSFDMDFNLEGADAAAMAAIGTALQDAQSSANPEEALTSLYPEIEDDLAVLLGRGLSVNLDKLDISLPQGTVSSTMEITIPENDAAGPVDWGSVLLQMSGKLDLRIPGAIYQMAAMMSPEAGQMIAMGILVEDGDDYVLSAEYAQGLFSVNGTPMPIPMPQ